MRDVMLGKLIAKVSLTIRGLRAEKDEAEALLALLEESRRAANLRKVQWGDLDATADLFYRREKCKWSVR